MHDPTDPAPETEAKPSRGLGSYVVWGFVVVMVYVLSMPPARLLVEKRIINRHLFAIYAPVGWAYLHTPLHKPIGLYAHLWLPDLVDANGDER